jgi:pimeloyl-ACP methyl ester carboxylesterase
METAFNQILGRNYPRVTLGLLRSLLVIIWAASALAQEAPELPYTPHKVLGGGGLELAAQEWGNPDGPPILLIHGFSQCHLCWAKQYTSYLANEFRIITMDIRGHGASAKPLEIEKYTDSKLWADDVAAVIRTLGLKKPVLVGWSYGGYIILDYIRHYGDGDIAGINLVGAAVDMGMEDRNTQVGEGVSTFGAMCSPDPMTNITGTVPFLQHCFAKPISGEDFNTILAYNMMVPPEVRAGLLNRVVNNEDIFDKINVPVLLTHGRADVVVLVRTTENIVGKIKSATPSFYEGVGHSPFAEDPLRFNRELTDFIRKVQ